MLNSNVNSFEILTTEDIRSIELAKQNDRIGEMERPNGNITDEPRIEFFSNDLLLEYSSNADIINQPENFNSDFTLDCSTNQ